MLTHTTIMTVAFLRSAGMIIVEFQLDHPVFRYTLDRVPDVRIEWEQSDAIDESRVRILVWAEGGLEEFEAAFEADPTVTAPTLLAEVGSRRLYQAELANEALDTSLYPLLTREGGVIRDLTSAGTTWEYRLAFPNRQAVDRFFDNCRSHGIPFEIHRLYTERDAVGAANPQLTDDQREALTAAVNCGYFEVPRQCTLAGLSDRLGISDSAVSQRLRRGTKVLVERYVDDSADVAELTTPSR